ncbi:hypothetical protein L7F22_017156 [Adiantum nelumboides]|nr:hypothetical protein [Adiantum nelumboides]
MLPGDLYGACVNVKVTIGDVSDEQISFIQEHSSYPLILGQPYITAVRMEIKVLDDGSAYARIRSRDGNRAVEFLTVCVNHARNKDSLRDHPLPRIRKEFQENRFPFSRSIIIKRDYGGTVKGKILQRETFSLGFLDLISEGSLSYRKFNELLKWKKNTFEFKEIRQDRLQNGTKFVKVHSMDAYEMLLNQDFEDTIDVQVETKYKIVAKKVKPVATCNVPDLSRIGD